MNVATITMDPALARKKLAAYKADLHKDSEVLYKQTAAAYEQLAQGTTLIRLSQAIEQAGVDDKCRPRLAVCRADRKEVKVSKPWREQAFLFEAGPFGANGVQIPQAARSRELRRLVTCQAVREFNSGFALVPMVPADIRPQHGHLRDWFVLWEVDHWSDRPHFAKASRDPMLLHHVGGDLYGVLATWDLTPIELAILEGAMRDA